jgi:hypothetical protein
VTCLRAKLHRQNGIERGGITDEIAVVRRGERELHSSDRHVVGRALQVLPSVELVVNILHAAVVHLQLRVCRLQRGE